MSSQINSHPGEELISPVSVPADTDPSVGKVTLEVTPFDVAPFEVTDAESEFPVALPSEVAAPVLVAASVVFLLGEQADNALATSNNSP